ASRACAIAERPVSIVPEESAGAEVRRDREVRPTVGIEVRERGGVRVDAVKVYTRTSSHVLEESGSSRPAIVQETRVRHAGPSPFRQVEVDPAIAVVITKGDTETEMALRAGDRGTSFLGLFGEVTAPVIDEEIVPVVGGLARFAQDRFVEVDIPVVVDVR